MRTDSNRIALRVIRNVLDGAKSFETTVGSVKVVCAVSWLASEPWPSDAVGIDEQHDGPWPAAVVVDCRWSEGSCRLVVAAYRYMAAEYANDLCLRAHTEGGREINFVNVANSLEHSEDGAVVKLAIRFYVTRRKADASDDTAELLNEGMRQTLAVTDIPILGNNFAELCSVEVPSGTLLPGNGQVFQRFVQLALLKLDFIDRAGTRERGRPLTDLGQWLKSTQVHVTGPDEEEPEPVRRRYWAGGFTKHERLEKFKAQNYWAIGWARTDPHPAGLRTWKLFGGVKVGDYFAIKGLGGTHDLQVHYVGEVLAVHPDQGRLDLRQLAVPLYKGKGPTGKGAGNWQNTLLPVTRDDIVTQIFGPDATNAMHSEGSKSGMLASSPAPDLPLNLILFGPPGTGKTYEVTKNLQHLFQQTATKLVAHADVIEELTWVQTVALALHDLGGRAKVAQLMAHPFVQTKYASSPMKAPLRQRMWSILQHHTVETSTTVKQKVRAGEQLFDKLTDSTWVLVTELPEELQEILGQLEASSEGGTVDNFKFVTFHQAYGYEDFIEGIRPNVETTDDEQGSSLSYRLEDGTFLQAARAALRLSGYKGSLHEFCGLSTKEREGHFDGAPHYAVFIDEINRGNVARIFGELITLLEDDKRLGCDNEVIVHLPYSKKRFGVPPNLHVIGTMNTADRSIEALDTALRRRFEFKELAPDPEELEFEVQGGIRIGDMLRAINHRLEKLYDRDHCIGHAYFCALEKEPTLEALKRVFCNKIIPLLQEYFHSDWGKIGLVLGKDFVRRRDPLTQKPFADFAHDDYELLSQHTTWELTPASGWSNLSFQRIYSNV